MKQKIMTVRWIALSSIVAILLLSSLFLHINTKKTDTSLPHISVYFSDNESVMQEISLYLRDGNYYAFFPAYADLGQVIFQSENNNFLINTGKRFVKTGEKVDLADFSEETPLSIILQNGTETVIPLYIAQSSNLATLSVTTESGTSDAIHESKDTQESATVVCINSDGTIDASGMATIKSHGRSTFSADKKSYRIKFKKRTALLGMDSAKKWILHSNIYDSSKLRNRICYFLADRLGLPFAVQTEYVDLYINGAYYGNYLLSDSMNVAKNRIDIPKTGTFLIEMTIDDADTDFTDQYGQKYRIKYPDSFDTAFANSVQAFIDEIGYEISNIGEKDSLEKLYNLIDLDSFAIMYIVDEITNEVDANALSTYYYYDSQSCTLHAGPAWDFDRSLGGEWNRGRYYPVDTFKKGFPEQLWKNEEFQAIVRAKMEGDPQLLSESLAYISNSARLIERSVAMDTTRWGKSNANFIDLGNYDYNAEYTVWNFQKRFALVSDIIAHPESYCNVSIGNERSGRTIWVKKGETISASQLAFLCELYNCEGFALSNGALIWDGFPILHDIVIAPTDDISSSSDSSKKEIDCMIFPVLIILFAPGLISLFLSGEYRIKSKQDIIPIVVEYGIYDFAALLFTYLVMFLMKGNATIGWDGALTGYDYPLSYVNVALKIMGLQLVGSIAAGLCAKLYFRVLKPNYLPYN